MNYAHIHLILNHIPIVGIPLTTLFLIYAVKKNDLSFQRFTLLVLAMMAIVILPVYFSGEPAEEVLKHLPEEFEDYVKPHEEAAFYSLTFTLITGATALMTYFYQIILHRGKRLSLAVIVLAVISTLSLTLTASLGGEIRHSELRSIVIQRSE